MPELVLISHSVMPMTLLILTFAVILLCTGCMAASGAHEGFPAPAAGLAAERNRMIESPTGLDRPLLVIGGWRTPNVIASLLARDLRTLTGADGRQTASLGVLTCNTMDAAVRRAIAAVEHHWPSDNPALTVQIDVVAISMGGLVARAAALPDPESTRKQLNIRRLYTLGTPHRGASLANRIAIDQLGRDMRTGSAFLGRLDEALMTSVYELVCYARTFDVMVGATNSAPEGQEPFWLHGPKVFSHSTTWLNQLIRLDIARRLRNEEPLALHPSPPPRD
jgi:pimeloyl-ACP methyl ester carboxylesterase